MKFRILFVALLVSGFSFGQATLPVTRTSWIGSEPTGWSQANTTDRTTTSACTGNDASIFDSSTDETTVFFTGTPSDLTFKLNKQSLTGAVSKMTVEESANGSSWTLIGNYGAVSPQTVITDCGDITVALLTTTRYVRWSYTKGTGNCDLDDVSITASTSTPTITLSPTTLTGFTYVFGNGPSAEQSFTAAGTNLTANIAVAAPTNYEVSTTSGSGFGTSVTLTPSSGTVSATTIYTRLKAGLAVAAYNESITASSTGASNKTVALTGSITGSLASDIIAVASSEAVTISSTINNAAPLTSATGVQVWQFKVRDGGVSLNDSDNLPTILTAFTLAQAAGNAVGTWSDAINTVALFDGATFIKSGVVTANQIQFTGLNVSVADNTEKTLSLRLSLKCPLGANAFNGEDFMFSLSSANTTFSPTGSGKTAFIAQTSVNDLNVISVVATKLSFLVQPVTTGVNGPMSPSVQVKAVDACGNFASSFSGLISITSTGTLSVSPNTAVAVNGIAVFNNLIHTANGTGLTLNATATGLTGITSSPFDINNITVLQAGDIAILAFNTGVASGEDEITFVNLVDILPQTRIDITDNAYQKCGTPNGWGISEGWIRLERKNTPLLAGTIVTIRIDGSGIPTVFSPDTANWMCTKPQPSGQGTFNLNNNGEQIFFMSGGNVGGTNATTATSDGGTYSGNFLFGFNTKGNVWTPVCGNSLAGGTENSDKPVNFDCFLTWPTAQADLNKYTGLLTPTSKRDWIERINNPSNWTGYANNTLYDAGPNYYSGSISITAGGFTNGVWVGSSNDNWFDCGNWQGLKVPDENINVVLDVNSIQNAKIDYTAPYSDLFLDIAKCRSLSVSNQSVELLSTPNNILYVYGDVTISGSGKINMDDGNTATNDGTIQLYGNWANSAGLTSFLEGNGKVGFQGTATQVINNNVHANPEEFYNVELNNNFNTANSNNLIAKGNLQVNAGKTVVVNGNDYVQVSKNLTNNGTFEINNNGILLQVDDTGVNSGNIIMRRDANIRLQDYVYWSSPIDEFTVQNISPITPSHVIWKWDPRATNPNGAFGNWINCASEVMEKGKGYIVRGPSGHSFSTPATFTATFQNAIANKAKPNNGIINQRLYRGPMQTGNLGSYTSANTVAFSANDDNGNLVGNPYPSAISVSSFLAYNADSSGPNPVIEGSVRIWSHTNLPVSPTNPFYNSYQYNYVSSDYIVHNGTATISGPTTFNGFIGAGQGFFVLMNDGPKTEDADAPINLVFNNAMRVKSSNSNSQFFKSANATVAASDEKHRIWIDLVNATGSVVRTVVGYVPGATLEKDVMYDAFTRLDGTQNFYSVIGDAKVCIQGRPVPFDNADLVPLGVSIPTAGTYTIAIAFVDGLFSDANQDIFVEDKVLNTIHNLRQAPYSFTSATGIVNDRFVLRYTNQTLGNNNFELNQNVVVATQNHQLSITSQVEKMKSVVVYDMLGREIANQQNVNNNDVVLTNIMARNQALIVKITLENGVVETRKIIL